MTNKEIITYIDKAMQYMDEDQKCAAQLMAKSNLRKADDTIGYRENTGAILYELKQRIMSEIASESIKYNADAAQIKSIKKLQELIAPITVTRNPSWQYAYYSEEHNHYILMCDYFLLVAPTSNGLTLIGNPKEYRLIDYVSHINIPRDLTLQLPNIAELELYIKQKKATKHKGDKQAIAYTFDNGYTVNAEWLYHGMQITHAQVAKYYDIRKSCKLTGSGYTFILMPAYRPDAKPTILPKISGSIKKLF